MTLPVGCWLLVFSFFRQVDSAKTALPLPQVEHAPTIGIFGFFGAIALFTALYHHISGHYIAADIFKLEPRRRLIALFGKALTLDDFFKTIASRHIEVVVYQFGLRPTLPIVDVLYLEYLRSLLDHDQIRALRIYPSVDLSTPLQGPPEFALFKNNVLCVLAPHAAKVTFFDPFARGAIDNQDLISSDFLATVKFIGTASYFQYLRDRWNLPIQSVADFNRYHPADLRLLAIFTHLVGAWQVYKDLHQLGYLETKGQPRELGFILWETEVDKLGVFKSIIERSDNLVLSAMLGKTIFAARGKPLPVFEDNAIQLFQSRAQQYGIIANSSRGALNKSAAILRVVLRVNYNEKTSLRELRDRGRVLYDQEVLSGNITHTVFPYPARSYRLIALLERMHHHYALDA